MIGGIKKALGLKKSKDTNGKNDKNLESMFANAKRDIKDVIIPNGINPIPDDHMEIINTEKIYTRTLYVRTIPKKSRFAYTFSKILKYPNTNVTVYEEPIETGKAISNLDKDINTLEVEAIEAQDNDRNRVRKISKKMQEAEALSSSIEAGDNQLFKIAIFLTVYSTSLDDLDKKCADLRSLGKSVGIQLAICYPYQKKAFKVCMPTGENKLGYWHIVDKHSVATLFHYTSSDFTHKKGTVMGRNISTGRIVMYDLFDPSLTAHNAIVTGVTGSGKSTLIKKIAIGHVQSGCKIICLDSDSPDEKGEYARIADKLNGVNIEINSSSHIRLNPFDVNIEYSYNEGSGREVPVFNLKEKILDATYILLTMARGSAMDAEGGDGQINNITKQIIQDIISEDYYDRGIYHGEPESLFTEGRIMEKGKLTSGKVKKELPTLTSWYQKLVSKEKELGSHKTYGWHYDFLKMVMKDWVNGLGTRTYLDGQSTYRFDTTIPFINIDVHKLNETFERPVVQLVAISKIWEDYVKKNSENPFTAEKIICMFDEVHTVLPFKEARVLLVNMYKRIRKKNGGVITGTQEITEFNKYKNTVSIITNSETKIIGGQDERLREDVKDILQLTESEVGACLSFDRPGMFLLKSKSNKVFLQSDILSTERLAVETNRSTLDKLKNTKSKATS